MSWWRIGLISPRPRTTVASGVSRQASLAKQEVAPSRSPRVIDEARARVLSPGVRAPSRTAVAIALEELRGLQAAVAEFVVEHLVVRLLRRADQANDHLLGGGLFVVGELPGSRFEELHLGLHVAQPLRQAGRVGGRLRHLQELGAGLLQGFGG